MTTLFAHESYTASKPQDKDVVNAVILAHDLFILIVVFIGAPWNELKGTSIDIHLLRIQGLIYSCEINNLQDE